MSLSQKKKARVNTLTRMLGIRQSALNKSSSPDVELIRTLKERTLATNHPMFKLSIEDYENMCNDDDDSKKIRIMAKLLNTTIVKLKKICKKMHILKENINLSPESIKNKMKEHKTPILNLPEELRDNIVNIFEEILTYELRDWIPIDKLDWDNLAFNPNSMILLDKYYNNINWKNLSNNPYTVELIRKYIFGKNLKTFKSNNPAYILKSPEELDWAVLSSNTEAIDLLEARIEQGGKDIDWYLLSGNSGAIRILNKPEYYENIVWLSLSRNPNAINLLEKRWKLEKQLKKVNIEQYNTLKYAENIVAWNILSGNPNAIDLLREKIKEESLLSQEEYDTLEYNEKIAWANLSENPEAIDLLEKNKYKIVWSNLSSNTNPKAIKLLKERVEYEKSLSIIEYKELSKKINWAYLSNNKNAIKILEENIDKIVWTALSNNLGAIYLLEANPNRIDWEVLSGNPNAINLLEANQDKINWEVLSRNPNAMNLLEANQDKINWDELSLNPSIFILK
jgi:hypothetical protein